jgi:hypothetical protein
MVEGGGYVAATYGRVTRDIMGKKKKNGDHHITSSNPAYYVTEI